MDGPPGSESAVWNAAQWVATTIIGLFTFFYGLFMKNISDEMKDVKRRQDVIARDAAEGAIEGDNSLRQDIAAIRIKLEQVVARDELIRLQYAIDEDRKQAAQDRANIAVMMATKHELERQLDKLYTRLMDNLHK
jgi:hypothetical protein